MKVYISADIEGVAGVTDVTETDASHKDFPRFAAQMSAEVAAACRGALAAGAKEILVKDAHWTARNIDGSVLPREARLIRGWSGHPQGMVDGLDETFGAALYIGFHSKAGSAGNPLAHTINGMNIQRLFINGVAASEFRVASHTANMHGVPSAFLSGDGALCREVEELCPGIATFAPFEGKGLSTVNVHPEIAVEEIEERVAKVIGGGVGHLVQKNPDHFTIEIEFKKPPVAYHRSFYPGATLKEERLVCFETDDWFEALRFMSFAI